MSKPPVKKCRSGPITVSVWENESERNKLYPTFTVDRSYREDGETKYTKSLTKSSLLHTIVALWLADRSTDDWDERNAEQTADGMDSSAATRQKSSSKKTSPKEDAVQPKELPEADAADSDELDSYL